MKQCPNCGNSNNDYDAVCSYCGFQFDTSADNNNSAAKGSYTPADDGSNTANGNYSANNYSNDNSYSAPYYQSSAPYQPRTNSFALASLILGIVSIPLVCCCGVGVITAILAVIFGFLARNKIMASNGYETGNGMALAGIIIGFAVIGIALILLIVSLVNSPSGNFWEQFNKNFEEQFRKSLEQQQNGLQ